MEESRQKPPDLDLLERYVLGRVDPDERTQVQEQLQNSHEWRDALKREQILAAGIRRLGRATIKQRLSERLRTSAHYATPWPRIALAAAVMVVVVGVGILNRWFVSSPTPDITSVEKLEEADDRPRRQQPVDKLAEQEQAMTQEVPPQEPPRASGYERRENAEGQRQDAARDLEPASAAEEKRMLGPAVEDQPAKIFWTEGTLIPPDPVGSAKADVSESKKESSRDRGISAETAREEEQLQTYRSRGASDPQFALQQRPFSSLTPSRQQNFSQIPGQTIPTRVEQRGDSLYLTLYTDPPFTETELQTATVLPVTDDSMVVTVGSQRIGYRLPEAVRLQQHTKAKQ
jgi:hypothetical protein